MYRSIHAEDRPGTTEEMTERYRMIRRKAFRQCEQTPRKLTAVVTNQKVARAVPVPKPEVPELEPEAFKRVSAAEVWQDFASWRQTAQRTTRPIAVIIREAAECYGVTDVAIKGRGRQTLIVAVRQTTMARAYVERPELSLVLIGRQFGEPGRPKDHTTVLHAIRKAEVWRNPGFREFDKADADATRQAA